MVNSKNQSQVSIEIAMAIANNTKSQSEDIENNRVVKDTTIPHLTNSKAKKSSIRYKSLNWRRKVGVKVCNLFLQLEWLDRNFMFV